MTPGIDISHHNPSVDWPTLARSDKKFVIMKATEGTDFVDPVFAERWSSALDNGFRRATYHFFRPDADPLLQAQKFVGTFYGTKGLAIDDLSCPLWIDVENSVRVLTLGDGDSVVKVWSTVQTELGQSCGIYGSRFTLDRLNLSFDKTPPLWLAHYSDSMGAVPRPWTLDDVLVWQNNCHGQARGVDGEVDLDFLLR